MTVMLEEILGGRYKILKKLGRGGFGQTYLAEDHHQPRYPKCLVKQLEPRNTEPDALRLAHELFEREAQTLERLGFNHEQIPQLFAYFEENGEFYLVMEFIEGEQLSAGQGWTEDKVVTLLQDILKILEFVHKENVIHRDIKPSNIIRRKLDDKIFLIDFGTVKQVTIQNDDSTIGIDPTVSVGTQGYMPNEQLNGAPEFCSDIYALGMLGIYLLTGVLPTNLEKDPTGKVIWNKREEVNIELATVLDKMVRHNFKERYQTATETLEALQQLPSPISGSSTDPQTATELLSAQQLPPSNSGGSNQSITPVSPTPSSSGKDPDQSMTPVSPIQPDSTKKRGKRIPKKVLMFLGLIVIALIIAVLIHQVIRPPQPALSNRFSLGDKILIKEDNPQKENKEKEEAAKAFAKGDFDTAINQLESSLKRKKNDPEALIYLNNAKAAKKGNPLRIAVSVPISGNLGIAQEMLRGVAQSQNEVNNSGGIGGALLQVEIANDDNKAETATTEIAPAFVKDQQILAVVGHNASEVSIAAAPIYQKNGLVMVSPTSAANELSNKGDYNYIFRTVPSVDGDAKNLATYAIQTAGKRKFAICIDMASPYSVSLGDAFRTFVQQDRGQFSGVPCELSDSAFNAADFIAKAKRDNVDGLLVTPSVTRIDHAIQLAKANQSQLALFGGSTLYSSDILQQGGANVKGMVLAVVWHPEATPDNPFPNRAKDLWGAEVNWRTAMSYDATLAIAKGLTLSGNSRSKLRDVLVRQDFQASGATGAVQFLPSGDRKPISGRGGMGILVKVEPKPSTNNEYKFSPIPIP